MTASFLNSRTQAEPRGIGRDVIRLEDARLVSGGGRYANDISMPDQAYAVLVRSPHAHARILGIDITDAAKSPGIIAVLTGADAARDGIGRIPHKPVPANPHEVQLRNRDGSEFFIAPHLIIANGKVRYVGEPVAIVIGTTLAQAADAAERVRVDYGPVPAVVTAEQGLDPAFPTVWETHSSNLCIEADLGDQAGTDAAFAKAAHTVRLTTQINRVTAVPLELRTVLASYDPSAQQYTLYLGAGGGVVRQRDDIAGSLQVAPGQVRVISGDIGGNFGSRNSSYPEFALIAWAAKRVSRPVKWTCSRSEAFVSDFHGRDLHAEAELALDAEGRFLALRSINTSNLGASAVSFIPLAKGVAISSSIYHVPVSFVRAQGVLTNTSPTTAYRSAGRPEVVFILERMIDLACRRHGFDRLELRRRNLVRPTAMPYRNAMGLIYDSGDYPAAFQHAIELSNWTGFEERRAKARERGMLRGIGIANSVELNTGAPRERAEITVDPEGFVELVLGTMSSGQGHQTSFGQVVSEWLGVEPEQVRLVTDDTDRVSVGGGSASARSMRLGSWVIAKAADQIVEKGRRIAAVLLQAAEQEVAFAQQRFSVEGTTRSVTLFEVADAALRMDIPAELRGPLQGIADETMSLPSFAYTSAVCEVEIDPETGVTTIVQFTSVDDCGRAVNPLLVHGQTHGGMAQGIGQALWEHCRYEPDSGQLTSGSLMDYALPRARNLPYFTSALREVPSTTNPLGMRGGGEGGITPSLAVVINAIVDALAELGVEHVELPASPERVWEAIRQATSARGDSIRIGG
jgi:carbon-monoxide dehydrogenase large subunit